MLKIIKKTASYLVNSVKAFSAVKGLKEACLIVSVTVMSSPAYAVFEKATNLITQFQTWLRVISVSVITGAIIIAGYKVIFGGQTFREVSPIILGGIVIGSAAEIAKFFAAN